MSNNDKNGDKPSNVLNFPGKGDQRRGPPNPPGGNGPPPFIPPQGLSQDRYVFCVVNKVTGQEEVFLQVGHLVITGANIVLFNERQEMIWGIPNDSSLIYFERLDQEVYEDFEDSEYEASLEPDEDI